MAQRDSPIDPVRDPGRIWADGYGDGQRGIAYIRGPEELTALDLGDLTEVATLDAALVVGFTDVDGGGAKAVVTIADGSSKLVVWDPRDFGEPVYRSEDGALGHSSALCDVDGDAHDEVINAGGPEVKVWWGVESYFAPTSDVLVAGERAWVVGGQLVAGGACELVFVRPDGGLTVFQDGVEAFGPGLDVDGELEALRTADLDGDGVSELVTVDDSRLRVWRWIGDRFASTPLSRPKRLIWDENLAIADMDSDGDDDLVIPASPRTAVDYQVDFLDGLDESVFRSVSVVDFPALVAASSVGSSSGPTLLTVIPGEQDLGCE